jgi:hypothetical protein
MSAAALAGGGRGGMSAAALAGGGRGGMSAAALAGGGRGRMSAAADRFAASRANPAAPGRCRRPIVVAAMPAQRA